MRGLALIAVVALSGVLAACGSSSSSKTSTSTTPAATAPAATVPQQASGGCTPAQAPSPRSPGKHKKPSEPLDASKHWTLTVQTNCGDFTIALDLKTGPKAAASLVALANAGYFKNTTFHRIAPGFVIQGGDPTATGSGGPGYTTVDPPPSDAKYTRGVVAMAKTQDEPAGAGGSQFFVVTGDDAGLPPDYAVIGTVTKGLDVVERIGQLGDQSEQPTQPVVISDIKAGNG